MSLFLFLLNFCYKLLKDTGHFMTSACSDTPLLIFFNMTLRKHTALRSRLLNPLIFTMHDAAEKIPRAVRRCWKQTLYGTVNVPGGPLSVISGAVVDTAVVTVRTCVLFCVLILWMRPPVIGFYSISVSLWMPAHGWTFFFFFISMSSVFLSTEVCFLNGASQCWLWHKQTMYKWANTHRHAHTSQLASGKKKKKWVLPYHCIPLPPYLT